MKWEQLTVGPVVLEENMFENDDRCFNILMAIQLVTLAEKPKLDLDLKDILGLVYLESMMTLASTVFKINFSIFLDSKALGDKSAKAASVLSLCISEATRSSMRVWMGYNE